MIRAGIFAVGFFSAVPAFAQFIIEDARSWGGRDGRSTVVGKLDSLSDDLTTVFLIRSDNGKRIQVPVDRLSALDYLYVREYISRFEAGTLSQELQYIPLASRTGDSVNDRWNLVPAGSIYVPPGTVIWKLLSSQPMLFGAFANDDDRFPELTVYFDPGESDPAEQVKKIQAQNEATTRFLEERGFKNFEGEYLKEELTPSVQKSLISGTSSSDEKLSCETHLRFDYQGTLVFRAFGTPERIQEMLPTIEDFRYLESDSSDQTGLAVGTTTPGPIVSSEVPSRVPAEIRDDFDLFRDQAISLLSRSNNARDVLEKLAEQNGLAKLKDSGSRWDSAIVSFDVRKRLRLKKTLQTLDWRTALFEEKNQKLTFALPDEIEFVKTVEGWKIVN